MGIIDTLKNVFSSGPYDSTEFDLIITESINEYKRTNGDFWDVKLNTISIHTAQVMRWDDKKKMAFVLYCADKIHANKARNEYRMNVESEKQLTRIAYLKNLLRARVKIEETDLTQLIDIFTRDKQWDYFHIQTWPLAYLIKQIEQQYIDTDQTDVFMQAMETLKNSIQRLNATYYTKEKLKLTGKIDAILFSSKNNKGTIKPAFFLGDDAFATYANETIDKMNNRDKSYWYQLITKAQHANGSKPSKKYLDETNALCHELGIDSFNQLIQEWCSFLINLKDIIHEHPVEFGGNTHIYKTGTFLTTINTDAIKGMIWICANLQASSTLQRIARLAERCYRKIPDKGPASASIGNACLFVLHKAKGMEGIGHLSRLKLRIKQHSTQLIIEKYLLQAAAEQGVSIHEIEDLAVDDAGLTEGQREFTLNEYNAILCITGIGKSTLTWYKPDGAEQKSVPSFIKDQFASEYKAIKDLQKQVDQTTSAQRDRIDRMFRANRTISMALFNERYLTHGLMQFLATKIIWNFKSDNQDISAIRLKNHWINQDNEIVYPADDAFVSLWHPAAASIANIKKWRAFISLHTIQQPFKQAFREVYLLTEAEINTHTYSNRMAAHVLKQHQFSMLVKTRGWKYELLGAYDNGVLHSTAEIKLSEYGLKAEYWINELNADGAFNDAGIWNYITTDQIRFVDLELNEPRTLRDIPIIPFSEVLRDVDLFVGVASVGNDPAWQDSGGLPAYRDYWTSFSFGNLSEVAKNRKEILTGLLPRLKINKVSEINDKFLVVRGKVRTYKIHIGSTNILMEPNDQYLCIVPDRTQKSPTEKVFIPFEGDTGLSIILSKAFLLADDDKITDRTITSQINHR